MYHELNNEMYSIHKRNPPSLLPSKPAGQFKLQQGGLHRCGGGAGQTDEVIDGNRRRPEQGDNPCAGVR
jgi:hypothetical protein